MDFKEELPTWLAKGIEPPASKKQEGWQVGDRPPAEWWNWFQNRTYANLKELKEVVGQLGVDVSNIDTTQHVHYVNRIKEEHTPRDFEDGVTISPITIRNSFPSVNEFGVSVTFINKLHGGYGQLVITDDGKIWTRRTSRLTSWGKWYSPDTEIETLNEDIGELKSTLITINKNKADKILVDLENGNKFEMVVKGNRPFLKVVEVNE